MDGAAANGFHDARWYAVSTRSRQERVAASMLDALQITTFFPVAAEVRQWSDRKQVVNLPLFPGYIFVRMNPLKENVLPVLKTPGVVGFVGNNSGPLPIPDAEIDDVRRVLAGGLPCEPHPFLNQGDRVRVIRGALEGLVGTLIRIGSRTQVVISIQMLHRSIAVSVAREDVERLSEDVAAESSLQAPGLEPPVNLARESNYS